MVKHLEIEDMHNSWLYCLLILLNLGHVFRFRIVSRMRCRLQSRPLNWECNTLNAIYTIHGTLLDYWQFLLTCLSTYRFLADALTRPLNVITKQCLRSAHRTSAFTIKGNEFSRSSVLAKDELPLHTFRQFLVAAFSETSLRDCGKLVNGKLPRAAHPVSYYSFEEAS